MAVLHLDGQWVALGRMGGAGLLAGMLLLATRQPLPRRGDLPLLLLVAGGVVLGFPLLTTLALRSVPASHGAVIVGLLPLATAVGGAVLAHERPVLGFWLIAIAGAGVAVLFALLRAEGRIQAADLLLLGAVLLAATGYAAGGRLAGHLSGWRVICWGLVLALPLVASALAILRPPLNTAAPLSAWIGLAYVTVVSQLLAFFAWYHGLVLGGIVRVGQVQLLQLFLTLLASHWLLGETVDPSTLLFGALVVGLVATGVRLRVSRPAGAAQTRVADAVRKPRR